MSVSNETWTHYLILQPRGTVLDSIFNHTDGTSSIHFGSLTGCHVLCQ